MRMTLDLLYSLIAFMAAYCVVLLVAFIYLELLEKP